MAFLTKRKMLIEVRKDILEKAVSGDKSATYAAASFLCELSLAVKRGKHIVYVPDLSGNIDLTRELNNVIGKNTVSLLKSSQKDKSKFHAIIDRLNTKAVCSFFPVSPEEKWDNIIHINPSEMPGLEVSAETFVIGENLSDVLLFDIFFDYYASLKRQKNVTRCYYPLMGGGGTTSIVYEKECCDQHHFCIVITDSDYKLPCEEGKEIECMEDDSTAKKVWNVHSKHHSKVSKFYSMRYVSEIENLIPKEIYQKFGANKHQNTVLKHDYSFFDMKKGLSFVRLWPQEDYNYWRAIFSEDVDFSTLDSSRKSQTSFESFKSSVGDQKLLKGWSNDVLKKILENPELVKRMRNITIADLNESQRKEWTHIGELMFNWTCALKPRYA